MFKEGETLNPFLLSDNERYLRDLDYIQDALIIVQKTADPAAVDLLVLVKDGFSIVPGAGIGGTRKYKLELKEQNLGGSGSMIAVSSLFDNARKPKFGYGGDFLQRNIRGSFINWGFGFKNYNNAFNSNRNEETIYYMRFEKPLVSQYLRWFGALDLSYNKTSNAYNDTAYQKNYRYSYYNIDGWIAYNIGSGKLRHKNTNRKIRNLVALRVFHQHFNDIPDDFTSDINNAYVNSMGVLTSFSVFKQNFYRTNYIYGFGRNEDVPQGFSVSIVGGYVKRSNISTTRTRPYFGLEFTGGKYNKKGFYSFYTFRLGGFHYKENWEDFDMLFNADHFTRLRRINDRWFKRFFFSGGIAKQFSPVLEQSLQLRSPYGLPYFGFGYDENFGHADLRGTIKSEAVFYHTKKYLGFGFAPFAFADGTLLKPINESLSKSDIFTAVGTGFRIRNENLLFGTIEARFSYFPRLIPGMQHIKVKFNTNLRYKYNSSLVRRPDFVAPN
ncbi:MAG: hypothetical protein IPP72_19365 [Chitinophagaceae bacterium]|nr:hypothetical protein [Chitinophagaceae bacterium]